MNPSAIIVKSWQENADNWIATIDNEEIESRRLVTNAAIVDTIGQYHKGSIIDIGCGEGWLTRSLLDKGFYAEGIDAIEALIINARGKSEAQYTVGTYNDIISKKVLYPNVFDSAVINFALMDKEESEKLIQYMPALLKKEGLLFIQTLHPASVVGTDNYVSGWREGSWNGLKQKFILPYKWYFRTLQDWCQLFSSAGFYIINIKEPLHPVAQKPASIIFVLKAH